MERRKHRGIRILIVEDNEDIRQVLADYLKGHDYSVTTAEDGDKGLWYLQNHTFDIMITDLGLPGISGWDLALGSKRYQMEMPVLAISSWQGKNAIGKIEDYGIARVVWKPFRFEDIDDSIRELLARQSPDKKFRLS